MKKIITICLTLVIMISFGTALKGDPPPQTLIEAIGLGLPAPDILDEPPVTPGAVPMGVTFYNDRATFNAKYPGLPVENFEKTKVSAGNAWGIPHPLDATSSNPYVDPGDILPGIQFWASTNRSGDELALLGPGAYGGLSKFLVANYFVDYFRIVFNPPVTAIGMDVMDLLGNGWCEISVIDDNGGLIATDVSGCNNLGVFWGVHSTEPIREIRIMSNGGGAEGADNIEFGEKSVILSGWAVYVGIVLMVFFVIIRFRRMV